MESYRHIRLVAPNDAGSLRWVRAIRASKCDRSKYPGDPIAREFDAMLMKIEPAVRSLISTSLKEVRDRILFYEVESGDGLWAQVYRELDFVVGSKEEPTLFAEIKLQERGDKGIKGTFQVRKSIRIAQHRWPDVRGIALSFYMGDVFGLDTFRPEVMHSLSTVVEHLHHPPVSPEGFWLDGEEMVQEAVRLSLLPEGFASELRAARDLALNPMRLLEQGDGSFGQVANAFDRVIEE